MLKENMKNVSVLGAGGKMGSGITFLLSTALADMKIENSENFQLNAIDVSRDALVGLRNYIKTQAKKKAEKEIVRLRNIYADRKDLIENEEMINEYVDDVLSVVNFSDRLESTYDSNIVFEAVIENINLKTNLLKKINSNNPNQPWFLSNTSSIPIRELDEKASLEGRIIGYHFYNPPAIQKLVELIVSDNTITELHEFSNELTELLRKKIVKSNDIAGFIGNGFFMRDILLGLSMFEKISKNYHTHEAFYIVNKITEEYLLRPMGIFQLMDYVGVDVCKFIMNVMNPHFDDEEISHPIIKELLSNDVKGGQYSSGAQKNGIFQYEKNRIAAVYDMTDKKYIEIDKFKDTIDEKLGERPDNSVSWKKLLKDKNKNDIIAEYFSKIKSSQSWGTELAVEYGKACRKIGEKLVELNVAESSEDVNKVMMMGFFHLYGPINNYFE